MKIIKYSEKDLMPVVITVLRLVVTDLLRWSAVIAANGEFIHLKEKIKAEGLVGEIVDLLFSASDWRIQMMTTYAVNIGDAIDSYAERSGLNLAEIPEDSRILEQAAPFYFQMITVNAAEMEEDYADSLAIFNAAILQVFYFLCELVILGEADLDHVTTENYFEKMFSNAWNEYRRSEREDFKLVAGLQQHMLVFYLMMSSNRIE